MKLHLKRVDYLLVLARVGLRGITPRELHESDLLPPGYSIPPTTTISMNLHRIETGKYAFGLPEGKTRRYFLSRRGRDSLNYHELMLLKRELKPHVNADTIRANRNRATEIKRNHEDLAKTAERCAPSFAKVIPLIGLSVNAFADLVCRTLDSIELPREEETALPVVRLCGDILAELQTLEVSAAWVTFLICCLT